jgi:hypothetical protein
MSHTQSMSTEAVASQRDAFIERFLQSASGAFSLFSIYIGDRLGLYRALAEGGPASSQELAERTNTHERYIREWLEQQTWRESSRWRMKPRVRNAPLLPPAGPR